jgi:methylmalonyl-CoA/ethylmalonyl-CoA epimerase
VAAQLDALREVATVLSEPHLTFTHEDDALGLAGTQEWQAFVTDSEGNTVGLVELRPV